MTPKGPPRARGLILALVAVLIVMSYAFWRAAAGSVDKAKATEVTNEAAPVGSAPTARALTAATDARAPAGGAGGHAQAAAAPPPPAAKAPIAPAAAPGEMNEAQLMTRLRAIKQSDPAGTVTLAREGNRRFPDSADAPERASILIHALVDQEKSSEARGEAEQMVNHYPDSSWVRDIEHFTGAHRHRAVGVNDAGQLIFR